ncbi:MAG: thiol-disulfide oxidoreductase DCC family protein [Pseudomonadales bacterium]|nr:thiol-disulfide oxidoreductase DCC family protein [Pseudomonadales bacterium]MCJ8337410.1 thiol-disulfide oxidoreductase DCC family protein [Pseudomonadales bacterium]NRA14831.1 thiol-disulfide oxidoreductase DCC family protein [Oceanospirillaceae bacterium]
MFNQQIIIFDGICNFCNGSVNFIIKRDHQNVFVFTPMQSKAAEELLERHQFEDFGFDTFVLIKDDVCYYRTDAALEIIKDLSGYWYLLKIFKLLPRSFRDFFYKLLARHRYQLFGKKPQCMIPTPEVKSKFLD